jgi:hypothetical protein
MLHYSFQDDDHEEYKKISGVLNENKLINNSCENLKNWSILLNERRYGNTDGSESKDSVEDGKPMDELSNLIQMVSNAICECNGFYNFKKNCEDNNGCLNIFCNTIYTKFIDQYHLVWPTIYKFQSENGMGET